MEELTRSAAVRMKIHNVGGTVIHHIALLKRSFDQKGFRTEIVKGWCVIMETKEACEHYWIRDVETGLNLDVGFAVAKLRSPELEAITPVLLEDLPPGLTRSDSGETLILAENHRLYELFLSDPKAFWRATPRDVATFHVK